MNTNASGIAASPTPLANSTAGVFVTFAYQPPPPPSVSIADASAVEGNAGTTAIQFPVTLSAATTQSNTVPFTVSSGTATLGSDIQTTSGSVTIPAGQTTAYATVYVYGDTTANRTTIDYNVKNNGRGPTMAETITFAPDGLPTAWTISGTTTLG